MRPHPILRAYWILWLWLSASLAAAGPARHPIAAWNFDWDDNIAFSEAPLFLFHKKTGERRTITSAEYAKYEKTIGISGEFADYQVLREPGRRNTFENYTDTPTENTFLKTLKQTVESKPPAQWQGPAWDDFVEVCRDPELARWATIITARENRRESILEGLRYLQKRGYLRYLPALDHLYPVGNPAYRLGAASIPEAKARTMETLLDRAAAIPDSVWAYSDDDLHNIEQARQAIEQRLRQTPSRWSHLKILLRFTGKNLPQTPPFKIAILPDGRDRPASDTEWSEPLAGHFQ